MARRLPAFTPVDALLLLVTIIWGSNFTVIKSALVELEPLAFNALRLCLASVTFLTIIALVQRRRSQTRLGPRWWSILRTEAPLTRRDWLSLVLLGFVGHFLYQLCFVGGLARSSVANSSLILGLTPATVALVGAAVGQERVRRHHWIGLGLSIVGLYFVVGHGAQVSRRALSGDALTVVAVLCWTVYTLVGQHLMLRHSPLGVNGVSMAIGTVPYVFVAIPALVRTSWLTLSPTTALALAYSATLGLCLSYMLWYIAVRQIGSARTSMYSNVTPLVAMVVAFVWLGEPIGWSKVAGAAAVLGGVAISRLERVRFPLPAEE